MEVCFVVYLNQDRLNMNQTLNSILMQDHKEYKVIVVDDTSSTGNNSALNYLSGTQESFKGNLVIMHNTKGQGFSRSVNMAIDYCQSDYIIFTEIGEVFKPYFLSDLLASIKKEEQDPEIIEFNLHSKYRNEEKMIQPNFENSKLCKVKNNPDLIARINPSIFNKVFKVSTIKKQDLKFRKDSMHLQLFLYKFIINCDYYLYLNKHMGCISFKILAYSIYNWLKQWTHIFNYYNNIENSSIYKDAIDIAYLQYLLIYFTKFVVTFYNSRQIIKALTSAQNKIIRRLRHLKNNQYANKEFNPELYSIIEYGPIEYIRDAKNNKLKESSSND